MIITSPFELKIGKIYSQVDLSNTPFETPEGKHYEYTFLVIRETSLKEFRKSLEKDYNSDLANKIISYTYFYEISID